MSDPHAKLAREKVAIVGVGGTGSHILDFVCKTPVQFIGLFDGDEYDERTPLRSPGPLAPGGAKHKVERHANRYRGLQRGQEVRPYPVFIDEENADQLGDFDTVFVCIGSGRVKRRVVEVCLEDPNHLLIDVGMAVHRTGSSVLGGLVRVTTLLPSRQDHVKRIGLDAPATDPKDRNHQTVELNALNAALAVIKWKKVRGVFSDSKDELHSLYNIEGNGLSSRYASGGLARC